MRLCALVLAMLGGLTPSLAASDERRSPAQVSGAPVSAPPLSSSAPFSGTSLKDRLDESERNGVLPQLDRSNSLGGPDIDQNGVRDDLDRWIATQSISQSQKKAALQMARSLQTQLVVNLRDKDAVQRAADALMDATVCLSDQFAPNRQTAYDLMDQTEAFTANTRVRAEQYMNFSIALRGSVISRQLGDRCDK